ncbi:MAG: hypothetical protein V1663_00705 [archaeon]
MIIDNEVVYKRVFNYKNIRRNLLNTAIESLRLLQDYERIKSIRKEKYQLFLYAKEKVLELNKQIESLKDKMPKAKIEKEKPLRFDIKESVEGHKFKIERPKISSLDLELENIKNKLQNLNIS